MSDIRNFEEYRRQVLDSLGEDYTVEDLRNEGKWRARVLDALGVEYDTSDTSYFERYRLKVLEGLQGGGGGGSSDFSTATVTVINDSGQILSFKGAVALEEDEDYSDSSVTVMSEEEITVIMYKGLAYCGAEGSFDDVSTTGNVSYDDGLITITGDGTITFGTPK